MRTLKEIKALYDTKQPSKEKDKTTQTPGLDIKSADEKRFADKHVIQKIADRNGNGDDVFNATNVNGVERSPKHGYNPGEDEKVYEGYVSLAQQRAVWATRKDGGKGHPDNKKKKMKEEVEIDEASKGPMDPEKKAKSAIDTILKNHEEPAPEKGMKIGEEKDDDKMEPSTKHVKAALKVRAKPELNTKDIKSYHRNVLNKDLKEAEKEDVPFEGPYNKPAKKQSGQKSDPGYSTARHLARQAMQKMLDKKEKMKEEVELDEGDVIPFPGKKKEEKPDTKPGWMLRKDPELAKKLKDAQARIKARKEAATQKEEVELDEMDKTQRPPGRGSENEYDPSGGEFMGKQIRHKEITKKGLDVLNKSYSNVKKEEVELDEVLKPSMGVKAYIDDFIKSDDPRFKGASKKERMKRALAAYYAAKRGD